MLSVADHRSRILADVAPLEPVDLPLRAARGLVVAEPVLSAVDLPGFDNSAMDGYAVRAADVAEATPERPVSLPVDGDVPAGARTPTSVGAGRAFRIMTGAPVPEGADTIIQVEHTDGGADVVQVQHGAEPGRHIRRAGEDVRRGDEVLQAGSVLGVRELTLVAASGCGRVRAHPRPKVLVMSTGDELVEVGRVPGFGEVVDSNGAMLEALLDAYGYESVRLTGVHDTTEAVLAALAEGAAAGADAVISTGGVSMGVYDAVKAALTDRGVRFEKVAMMPGKPQGFGVIELAGPAGAQQAAAEQAGARVPVFTLPGNPVSAYVSFHVFVLPALQRMSGAEPTGLPLVRARVEGAVPARRERTQYQRARLRETDDGWGASVVSGQGSHMLAGLAEADGLLIVPATSDTDDEPGLDGERRFDCLVFIDGAVTPAQFSGLDGGERRGRAVVTTSGGDA